MANLTEEQIKLIMDDCDHAVCQGHAKEDMDPHATLPAGDVLAMANELLERRKQAVWNTDMSEAPKDGTIIDLADHASGHVSIGYWMEGQCDLPDEMGWDNGWQSDGLSGDFSPPRSFGNPDYMTEGFQPTAWRTRPTIRA